MPTPVPGTYHSHAFHGGSCCGMSHIFNVYSGTKESIIKALNFAWTANYNRRYHQSYTQNEDCVHVVEVTLLKGKSNYDYIRKIRRFKKVAEFRNMNSPNIVQVYHYYMNGPIKEVK